MEPKVSNLELILFKAGLALSSQDEWKAAIEKIRQTNKFARPFYRLEVFPQTWGSTCTGFDVKQDGSPAFGGQAITEAYTTVVHECTADFFCVFFGENLCYEVSEANEDFFDDLKNHRLASFSVAKKKY